jgi:uncharacterized protein (DUF58 family)
MSQAIWDVATGDDHATPDSFTESTQAKVSAVLSTDFCPWANKYVYWLKEPIGWFVIALGISVLVGMHVSPLGWTLASAIAGIIAIGMIWPWVAIQSSQCKLAPAIAEIYEGQSCELVFSVRNRLPFPMWGLAVEGFLDCEGDNTQPTIALACVPPVSSADYRLAVHPALRGHYPIVAPNVTCSFPFGIWTARREVAHCSPLIVFPQVSLIQDEPALSGGRLSESGEGLRAGQMGELLGVREFRSGDRLRNVHWVHTARTGNLVVCERGGPQQQAIEVNLDTHVVAKLAATGARDLNREAIAWRVRVAASLVTHLHARHIPVTLRIDQKTIHGAAGPIGLRRMLLELANIPADGNAKCKPTVSNNAAHMISMRVTNDESGAQVLVDYVSGKCSACHSSGNAATSHPMAQRLLIDLKRSVPSQLLRFWRGVEHGHVAA